jgi:hypothetical protein
VKKKEKVMMKKIHILSVLFIAQLLPAAIICSGAVAGGVEKMDIEELKNRLGEENLVIIDVRAESDWKMSEFKIKGALRRKHKRVADWAVQMDKDKTYVLY